MTMQVDLSKADLRRLEKLAAAAGRTPRAMLKFVLRDGFPETERIVSAVKQGRSDAEAGRTVPHEEVMRQARTLIAHHAKKKKAA